MKAIKKRRVVRSKSEEKPSAVSALKKRLEKVKELQEQAREYGNAANREMTRFKNDIFAYLKERGAKEVDGVVIGGSEYAYRPGVSEEINPREWHKLFAEGRISENQYFAGLKISISEAKKAVGTDQIDEISVETLGKTATLRVRELPKEDEDGTVIEWTPPALKTAQQVRQVSKPLAGTGLDVDDRPVKRQSKKVIKVRR